MWSIRDECRLRLKLVSRTFLFGGEALLSREIEGGFSLNDGWRFWRSFPVLRIFYSYMYEAVRQVNEISVMSQNWMLQWSSRFSWSRDSIAWKSQLSIKENNYRSSSPEPANFLGNSGNSVAWDNFVHGSGSSDFSSHGFSWSLCSREYRFRGNMGASQRKVPSELGEIPDILDRCFWWCLECELDCVGEKRWKALWATINLKKRFRRCDIFEYGEHSQQISNVR